MFARLLFNKQHARIGRNLFMCMTAAAITLPLVAKDYNSTHCDKVLKVETKGNNVTNPLDNSGSGDAAVEELAGNPETIKVVIDEDSDIAWMEENSNCFFCRAFASSPCKKQFRYWSTCMDLARSQNKDITLCSEYFVAMQACTSKHPEFFKELEAILYGEEESAEASADGESGTTDDLVSHTETREVAVHGVRLDSEKEEPK